MIQIAPFLISINFHLYRIQGSFNLVSEISQILVPNCNLAYTNHLIKIRNPLKFSVQQNVYTMINSDRGNFTSWEL